MRLFCQRVPLAPVGFHFRPLPVPPPSPGSQKKTKISQAEVPSIHFKWTQSPNLNRPSRYIFCNVVFSFRAFARCFVPSVPIWLPEGGVVVGSESAGNPEKRIDPGIGKPQIRERRRLQSQANAEIPFLLKQAENTDCTKKEINALNQVFF